MDELRYCLTDDGVRVYLTEEETREDDACRAHEMVAQRKCNDEARAFKERVLARYAAEQAAAKE